jgi:two-component system cell cycle response regulator
MTSSIFTGVNAEVYYSSLSVLTMTLMLLLSIRLLISRQKRAYLTLSLCMGIMLIGQIILLGAGLIGVEPGRGITITHNMLNSGSFVLANMGIYQLFGVTTKRVTRIVYGLLVGVVLLSFIPIAINIYAILLVAFSYIVVKPHIEDVKYQTGLIFYAIATLAHFFAGSSTLLQSLDNLCRIAFFSILFIILFDKVLNLMEASYNKSTRDSLTGLYNRFYFFTAVSFLVSENKPISVVFFDLDNFKKLNDTLGHDEGDKALKAVASIIKEESEEVGVAGRYGGEEMVLLIEDPAVIPSELAEKLRGRIEDETIVTASIGFATYQEGNTTDELIKNADKAMYVAKKTGKNRVISFNDVR